MRRRRPHAPPPGEPAGVLQRLGPSFGASFLRQFAAFDGMVTAQDYTLGLMQTGARCRDVFTAYNAFMRGCGWPDETRLHCHSQGYDSVERPLMRHDETMTIAPGMNIGIHPSVLTRTLFATVCDNFLTRQSGPPERLHKTPREIFEI